MTRKLWETDPTTLAELVGWSCLGCTDCKAVVPVMRVSENLKADMERSYSAAHVGNLALFATLHQGHNLEQMLISDVDAFDTDN